MSKFQNSNGATREWQHKKGNEKRDQLSLFLHGNLTFLLGLLGVELLTKGDGGEDPETQKEGDQEEEDGGDAQNIRGTHAGLHQDDEKTTSGLTETSTNDIDGGFTLHLHIGIQRNVGHFFGRVKEGVLGGLGQGHGDHTKIQHGGEAVQRTSQLGPSHTNQRKTDQGDDKGRHQSGKGPAHDTHGVTTNEDEKEEGDETGRHRKETLEEDLVVLGLGLEGTQRLFDTILVGHVDLEGSVQVVHALGDTITFIIGLDFFRLETRFDRLLHVGLEIVVVEEIKEFLDIDGASRYDAGDIVGFLELLIHLSPNGFGLLSVTNVNGDGLFEEGDVLDILLEIDNGLVNIKLGVSFTEGFLVEEFDLVDTSTVQEHHGANAGNVLGGKEELERLGHGQLGLLLLGLGFAGVVEAGIGKDVLFNPVVDVTDDEAKEDDETHQDVHGILAATRDTLGDDHQDGTDKQKRKVGTNVDDGVETLGFRDTANIVGETPEEEGQDDGTPHFGHDVEEGGRPGGDDVHGSHEGGRHIVREDGTFSPFLARADLVFKRVQDGTKEGKEGQKETKHGVKDLGTGHGEGHLGEDHHEDDGRRQDDTVLQPRDGGCVHGIQDEDVFEITQQRVVEAGEKHHGQERKHLLLLMLFDGPELLAKPAGVGEIRTSNLGHGDGWCW